MKITIIGAGPGDPDLITVKGLRLLQEADVVMYADSLVSEALIAKSREDATVIKTAGMHLEEMVNTMVSYVKEGKKVVRVHTGDPAVYGATLEQMTLLKQQGVHVEIIPGVSSVFASAAAIGAELTVPDLTQTVILTRAEGRTKMPDREKLKDLASHHCTIALFLSATLTKKIVNEFLEAGWSKDTPVAAVYKATWPDEKIVRTTLEQLDEDLKRNGMRKQVMILAGWALDEHIHEKDFRSKLYDKTFTHGFRKGVTS
ncbi:precorrin-4 C11-methyltransferase [Fictibacillus macauensis ZFHKF-1]|uniref:Precorrin-4 C11-methyltransferase n=1 Tax=Fictibacillus macauensis ZFHKF-1 TaxID=1196324 RepID=I8AKV9_9BACL|nr:precorrin-4 C(11)-methyltransferase [Fictibacillus macauensis]EIT86462.1 precorrin-4 C11-methyltransferase [Fictibacillus macauensis ZFHKF-1]